MIRAKDAIAQARALLGTPYSEMDCIALIRAVIRQSPGGVRGYRCQGTNWLWDSVNNTGKYRHLTQRHEGLDGVPAGALPFKRYGEGAEDHVGIATGEGTVIHASSVYGRVVETPLTPKEGWDCWGVHREIAAAEQAPAGGNSAATGFEGEAFMTGKSERSGMSGIYRVNTQSGPLNIRKSPGTGAVIGQIPKGERIEAEGGGEWPLVRYGEMTGYVSAQYLAPVEAAQEEDAQQATETQPAFTSLVREDGTAIMLAGRWRLATD